MSAQYAPFLSSQPSKAGVSTKWRSVLTQSGHQSEPPTRFSVNVPLALAQARARSMSIVHSPGWSVAVSRSPSHSGFLVLVGTSVNTMDDRATDSPSHASSRAMTSPAANAPASARTTGSTVGVSAPAANATGYASVPAPPGKTALSSYASAFDPSVRRSGTATDTGLPTVASSRALGVFGTTNVPEGPGVYPSKNESALFESCAESDPSFAGISPLRPTNRVARSPSARGQMSAT